MERSARGEATKTNLIEGAKAIIVSLIVCLLLVLVSSFIINLFEVSDSILSIINTVIKILSILVGCLVSFKSKSDGWLKGIITGVVFIPLAFIVFSILNGKFEFSLGLLIDVLCGAAAGLISGIIAVNIRK